MKNLFSIEGKVVFISGGSRGIGEMITAGFLSSRAGQFTVGDVITCHGGVVACS